MNDKEKEMMLKREEKIKNGTPVVDLSIFDILNKFEYSERLKDLIDYTFELYEELLDLFYSFDVEQRQVLLSILKNDDIKFNQELEKEDPFMIEYAFQYQKRYAIDELLENYNTILTKDKFIHIHDLLLYGTSSENKTGLRKDNMAVVTKTVNGVKDIDYFPISFEEIDEAIDKLLLYYNNISNISNKYDAFMYPIIFHGLIATLQLFEDGNTRFARLFQSVIMWNLLNKVYDKKIELPIVYTTQQLMDYYSKYRGAIANIVKEKDSDAWEKWAVFNLFRIQDGILNTKYKISKLKHIR